MKFRIERTKTRYAVSFRPEFKEFLFWKKFNDKGKEIEFYSFPDSPELKNVFDTEEIALEKCRKFIAEAKGNMKPEPHVYEVSYISPE